jgi:hypothetical protein
MKILTRHLPVLGTVVNDLVYHFKLPKLGRFICKKVGSGFDPSKTFKIRPDSDP